MKPIKNKRAYQFLCVYYGVPYVNIYKLLESFDVTLADAEYFNKVLNTIFKDTEYADSLRPSIQPPEVLSFSDERVTEGVHKMVVKLKNANLFKDISKETFGAIGMYVARDILNVPYTFVQIQKELDIKSAAKLNTTYRKIYNFIKANPKLLR